MSLREERERLRKNIEDQLLAKLDEIEKEFMLSIDTPPFTASGKSCVSIYGPVIIDEVDTKRLFMSNKEEVDATMGDMKKAKDRAKSMSFDDVDKKPKRKRWQQPKPVKAYYRSRAKSQQLPKPPPPEIIMTEKEKELDFRRRQLDRYLGDLRALDEDTNIIKEIEDFLESFEPKNKEEEIMASSLWKLLGRIKDERGIE